jgi:hypothetical protein
MDGEQHPTLGGLRRAVLLDPPAPDQELIFDFPGTQGRGLDYLPDAIVVHRELIDRVAAGGCSELRDSTPLEEIL